MIWRRLLVCGDSTIADLHYIVQITMGWSDDHLHQFRIHGKRYGIARLGGVSFSDDPDSVRLKDLGLRINEHFFYEYDFTDDWQHLIRVEAFLAPAPHRHYPVPQGFQYSVPSSLQQGRRPVQVAVVWCAAGEAGQH